MGIFDRLRSSDEEETEGPSLSSRARQDLRRAERGARRKASELRTKAGRDVRRGRERAVETARDIELSTEGRSPGNVDSPETGQEVVRKAGRAAQLRSPVDATLDPSPSGPELELFASAGVGVSDDRRERESDNMGLSVSFDEGQGSDNPLEVSDDMGILGDSDSDSENSGGLEDLL